MQNDTFYMLTGIERGECLLEPFAWKMYSGLGVHFQTCRSKRRLLGG